MGIILPLLLTLLISGFFVHDLGYLQGTACEIRAMGSSLQVYENKEALMAGTLNKRMKKSLLWSKKGGASFAVTKEHTSADVSASFRMPGFAAPWTGGSAFSLRAAGEFPVCRPADTIRKLKGAKALINGGEAGT